MRSPCSTPFDAFSAADAPEAMLVVHLQRCSFSGCLLAGIALFNLARPIIATRAADTRDQLAAIRAQGGIGSRATLYIDTWRMAADRPAFGWGLGSYPAVFQRYNTQQSADGLPVIYVDAHSDWLQSLAETGFTGTAFLGFLVMLPAAAALRHRPGPLPAYLLVGCGLVLLYAWIEFPFGCPAVIAAFWLLLFTAARLAQLDAHDRAGSPRQSST
ncbi:MAG: O-antigen ligase family protein [Nibricoccus sp.]